MIIKNGRVFQEDGTFAEKDLYIEGKRFVSTKEEVTDQEVIDAKGMMVLPGLVDVHSHGAAGHDFSDGDVEGLKAILRYEKEHGITSYCPTSMTLPKDDLLKIFGTIEEIKDEPEAEVIAGVNMEGPFIDPVKKGAQAEENIVAPNAEFFRECNAACVHSPAVLTFSSLPAASSATTVWRAVSTYRVQPPKRIQCLKNA